MTCRSVHSGILPDVQSANNLRVTARARALATGVYRATAQFPVAERFGLTAQMRRAAVSIGSNIAEGCGHRSDRELVRWCRPCEEDVIDQCLAIDQA